MRVAVVVIVKNESQQILSWIGWYRHLGVDTIFLTDDHSTDRTADIARDASRVFDVRVRALDKRLTNYRLRQRDFYIAAIQEHGEEYDWIGFFDADEYLRLQQDPDIKTFLSRFPEDVGQVCINWCNYGSSGHIEKSEAPDFCAYTWHSRAEEGVNRHVKSFIRPRCWAGNWLTVHSFDVGACRTVNAEGRDVVWSPVIGITADQASWSVAKVMHYQCRSMQDFVERYRRRNDVPSVWEQMDFNDEEDPGPLAALYPVHRWAAVAVEQAVLRVSSDLGLMADGATENAAPAGAQNLRFFRVYSHAGCELALHGETIQAVSPGAAENAVLGFKVEDQERLYLYAPGNREALPIYYDRRLAACLGYDLYAVDERAYVLQHPRTQRFVSAAAPRHGGQVVADRRTASADERFELEEITDWRDWLPEAALAIPRLASAHLGSGVTLSGLRDIRLPNDFAGRTVAALCMGLLKDDDQAIVQNRLGGMAVHVL